MLNRLKKVHIELKKNKLDALLISTVPNIVYLTGYLGFSNIEREAYLLATQKNTYLFTDARYSEAVLQNIPHVKLIEVSAVNPITKALADIVKKERLKKVGFEPHNVTVSECIKLKKAVKLVPTNDIVETIREIKEPSEIAAIEKVCRLGDKVFSFILPLLKPGMAELEIATKMEIFMRKNGAKPSFPSIVAFGKNAAIPHHHTGNTRLNKKDLVLLDFGVEIDGYCSDMTRTVFVGKPNDEQTRMYNTVLEAQNKAIEILNLKFIIHNSESKKTKASDIDKIAREHIISQGYPTIPHSLGHGIGLEVHELPRLSPGSDSKLTEGMVFSIEPGIYFPGKYGVRIEDLVVIEKGRLRVLTKSQRKLIVL